MNPKAKQQLSDFFQQLEVERRASPHTIKSYQFDMNHLMTYCAT
ncbi:MAG: site-specific integrase, partial [Methylococcales bacterium]|nr:site-specific integrase [Methylococcales bacterium]